MRGIAGAFLGVMAGLFGWSIGAGVSGSWAAGGVLGAAVGAIIGWLAWRGSLVKLDARAVSRGLLVVSALAATAAVVLALRRGTSGSAAVA
jgi:hypothetical protein